MFFLAFLGNTARPRRIAVEYSFVPKHGQRSEANTAFAEEWLELSPCFG
jgi:hypothetical protein